jgi:hypothetical protein
MNGKIKDRFFHNLNRQAIGLLIALIANLTFTAATFAKMLPIRVFDESGNFRECGKFGKVLLNVTDMKTKNQTDAKVYQWAGCNALSAAWPERPQDKEFPPVRIRPSLGYPLFIGSRQCGYIKFTFQLVTDPQTGLEKREKVVLIKNCKLFSDLMGGEKSTVAASDFPEEFGEQQLIDETVAPDSAAIHR